MFKLTRGGNGLRRSSGSGSGRTPRVQGMTQMRGRDITTDNQRKPAFVPMSPQESGFDSDGPRMQGLEKNIGGGEH